MLWVDSRQPAFYVSTLQPGNQNMTQSPNSRPALQRATRRAVSIALTVASSLPLTTPIAIANAGAGSWSVPPASAGRMPTPLASHANFAHLAGGYVTTSGITSASHAPHAGLGSFSKFLHSAKFTPTAVASDVAANGALNLTSSQLQFLAGNLANFSQLTIDVGGKPMTVSLNTNLTAAEVVAVEQKLTGGTQGLHIEANGAASGGTITLNNSLLTALDGSVGGSINALTIAHGVKVLDNLSNLTVDGTLTNYGQIVTTGSHADTITATDLTNSGIIRAVGSLFIDSNTLNNTGSISSQNDLSFRAASVVNGGLLSSSRGNVNFVNAGAIEINGSSNSVTGTVSAANGAINFHDSAYAGSGGITAVGGNYSSQSLNFNAGNGDVNANLGNVSGVINATAYNAHIGADTANLHLGKLDVANDPTYFNGNGNILIDGTVLATNGNPLAIVASGNVIGAGGSLDTSNATAGGNLTVIAGASFTTNGPGSGSNDLTTTLNITGASASGGYIDLAGVFKDPGSAPLTAITTQSTGGQAGNVTMVAFSGTGPNANVNSGSIVMPTPSGSTPNVVLNAAGATPAQNGDVTIIGNGVGTNGAILVGDVVARNVSVSGGTATGLSSQSPMVITNGAVTSGGFTAPTAFTNTYLTLGNVTASGNVIAQTAGQIAAGNITAPSQTVTLASTGNEVDTGNINVGGIGGAAGASGANGGTINITASKGIFTGNLDATGGGGGGGSINSNGTSQNGGNGGSGGSINLTAGSDNIQVDTVNASGGGGGGGAGATASAAMGALGGIGGTGGAGGTISLSTNQAVITEGPLLAYGGGNGGTGGAYTDGGGNITGGAGGGGGGAFGGGGGGGAAYGGGQITTVAGGGAGGAGVYGGGGGGGATISTLITGGAGGSSSGPGAGGSGDAAGQSGSNMQSYQLGGAGGNPDTTGLIATASGGVFGSAGQAGQSGITGATSVNTTATNGTNASTATQGGVVTLQFGANSYNGQPASQSPIEADAGRVSLVGGNNGSISLNLYGDTNNLNSVTMGSNSTLQVYTTTNLSLSNISAGNLNITESGIGTVSGNLITAYNLALNGTSKNAVFDLNGAISNLTVADPLGTVQVQNMSPFNTPLVIGNVSAAQLFLYTNNDLVQTAKTTISGADIFLSVAGNTGTITAPIVVNATNSLNVEGPGQASSFFLKDNSTAALTFFAGEAYAPLSVNLQSASQALSVTDVVAKNVVINDTNSTGNILFNPGANSMAAIGTGQGSVSITAVGSILGSTTTAAPGIQGTTINLVSKNGSVGGSDDTLPNYITIDRDGGSTVLTGSAKNGFLVSYSGNMYLGKITGNTISFVTHPGGGSNLFIEAPIGSSSSTAVLLQADASIQVASNADVVTGKTVQLSLATGGNIGSLDYPIQTKAGILSIFGSSSGSYVNGSGAFVNQTGNVILGTVGAENVTINSTGSITTGASTVVSGNNVVYAANTLNLFGSTGITVGLGNVVEAANATLSTAAGKITINGTVSDSLSTSLEVTKGSLQVLGAGTFTPGTSLTLSASGNVTIVAGDLVDKLTPDAGTLQNFTVQAGGVYTSPYTSYVAASANGTDLGSGNGGNISITAGSLKFSTTLSGPLSLSADSGADATANGGSVTLNITGPTSIAVTTTSANVPKGSLQVVASATGNGNAGSIAISGGGSVFVDSTGFDATGQNGNGANLTFAGGKNLAVAADLTTAALASSGTGIAGTIILQSNSTTPFTVGTSSVPLVNGTQTAINGGLITINAPAGIVITQPIASSPATNVAGGLSLNTANLQINNTITLEGAGQLNITSPSGLTLNVGQAAGQVGSYTGVSVVNLQANKGNITLGNFFNSPGSETADNFSDVSLQAPAGLIIFPTTQNNLSVGAGGSIIVQAKALSFTTPNFAFNVINGGGAGGNLQISTVAPLSVGTGTGQISVDTQGAGGGSVSLASAGNLSVDFNALTVSPSNVSLTFQGTNVLLTNAAAVLTGSTWDNLSITSNSSNTFLLGGATKNGIVGTTAGATISVANGLTLFNNGGAISDQTGGSVLLSAGALNLYAKGDIDPLNFSAGQLSANSAGNITLVEQPGQALTVSNLAAGAAKTVTFTTAAGSAVNFQSDVLAKTFILTNNGTVSGTASTNASVLNVNTSTALNMADTLTGGVNLTGLTATGNFALQSAGTMTVSGVATSSSAISLSAGGAAGSISITGKTAAITSTASGNNDDVILAASGTGSLKSAAAANTVTAATLALTGGTVTSSSVLRANAQEFDLLGGAINVSNASTGAVSIGDKGSNSLVSLTYASTATDTGILTVGAISTAGGGISIVANSSKLDVASGELYATNGNILLQNNDLLGSVTIESNAVISAVGSTSASGKVTITEGTVPSGLKQFIGTAPNLTVNQVNGGKAYLGGKTSGATFTAAGNPSYLTADGSTLTINAGTNASGVVLNGQDFIDATSP